jgi:hypothetical protein
MTRTAEISFALALGICLAAGTPPAWCESMQGEDTWKSLARDDAPEPPEPQMKVPVSDETHAYAQTVVDRANAAYHRLADHGVSGFEAVFDLTLDKRGVGAVTVRWPGAGQPIAVTCPDTMPPQDRAKAEGYAPVMAGPLCGYLIRPEAETGYPLYAVKLGDQIVVDISGGGAVPNLESDLFFVAPDFLQVREAGLLKDGTKIHVLRKGVSAKKGAAITSMAMAIHRPDNTVQSLDCAWTYGTINGVRFVKTFTLTDRQGDTATSVEFTLSSVSFRKTAATTPATRIAAQSPAPTTSPAVQSAGSADKKPDMKKMVTDQANFVVYAPQDWRANETANPGFRSIAVTDPTGQYQVTLFCGFSPAGDDVAALTGFFVREIRKTYPDLKAAEAKMAKGRLVFDGTYTDAKKNPKEFRFWTSVGQGWFTASVIEAPRGKLDAARQQLLTILSNIRVTKGAYDTMAGEKLPMITHRLSDGSASFHVPNDWQVRDIGVGAFIAGDPTGQYAFLVASAEAITPQVGASGPGFIVSNQLDPHEALAFFAGRQGLMNNIRFLEVTPCQEVNAQLAQGYNGPANAEEFVYTFTNAQGLSSKGYTFGISFGSRLNINWRLWHMTVTGPADKFDAFVPNYADMLHSYAINDEFAKQYIAAGMARVREMERQTSALVARNAQEIRSMMNAAFQERMRSGDYIDYQRTSYIRGTSDWISDVEGGAVYHSDSWGTTNTATGDYYKGAPYNYVNFEGQSPKYNEQMTPVNDRATWERAFGGGN